MGSHKRHPDGPQSEEHDLQRISKKLGLCRGACDVCGCSAIVKSVLGNHNLEIEEVMNLSTTPKQLKEDAKHIRENRGERVEERDDYQDIHFLRLPPKRFESLSDDEL